MASLCKCCRQIFTVAERRHRQFICYLSIFVGHIDVSKLRIEVFNAVRYSGIQLHSPESWVETLLWQPGPQLRILGPQTPPHRTWSCWWYPCWWPPGPQFRLAPPHMTWCWTDLDPANRPLFAPALPP